MNKQEGSKEDLQSVNSMKKSKSAVQHKTMKSINLQKIANQMMGDPVKRVKGSPVRNFENTSPRDKIKLTQTEIKSMKIMNPLTSNNSYTYLENFRA